MIPFLFGAPDRQLFGTFHPAEARSQAGMGVVICAPFGHEAIRTHRMFRVLAERLTRAGHHVLRFNYYGTGDSGGSDEEGDLLGWSRDILSAHRELQRRVPVTRVAWIGARLGATAALRAAVDSVQPAPYLVLLDPVVAGAEYLQLLRSRHVEALETSFSIPDPAWRTRLASDPDAFIDEAIGFAISPALREQVLEIDRAVPTVPPSGAVVIASAADASARRWAQVRRQAGDAVEVVTLEHTLVWTSDDSLNSALVPAEVVEALLRAVEPRHG